jgi:hypothetical protein
MERGVYFQGWFARQHNYHPARPPRRLKMIEDLVEYRATLLVWSALGGGSISLPYLEAEAWGPIDQRFRMYGFVNEAEFVAAAQARGIKVSGTVFSCQGWEFPAELDEPGTQFLALNEERGAGRPAWAGLREFTQDALPGLWRPFRDYFPDGLSNSDGEPVTDLLEECCSRAIDGAPLHATWLEAPDRRHFCRYMDRSNPVWLEYLKAIVRVQIDAGVAGVQFDETETPLGALQYGGCFCKDCMKRFAAYLRALPERPPELAAEDLETFHYGRWLQAQGHTIAEQRHRTPLFWHYLDAMQLAVRDSFAELAAYTREYAASKGREVLVSGNFFNVFPYYDGLVPHVDVLVTEMRNTAHRQPAWYRYAAGVAGAKPVVVVENPYGGIVPELVADLARGRGHDRVRLSLYEGAAMGVNVTVPYGAWMGATIEDAYYAPHELAVEVQAFLADMEPLAAPATAHEIGVLFSMASTSRETVARDAFANVLANVTEDDVEIPFWDAASALAGAGLPIDVVVLHDGRHRVDDLAPGDVAGYRTLVAAGCHTLTPRQLDVLAGHLDAGGELLVSGRFAGEHLLDLPGARRVEDVVAAVAPQVVVPAGVDVATTIRALPGGGHAVHVVNYAHDEAADAVVPARDWELRFRVPGPAARATLHRPGEPPAPVALARDGEHLVAIVDRLDIYAIVEVQPA